MEEQGPKLTKKERRLLAKEQKREEQESVERKGGLTKFVIGLAVVGLLAAGAGGSGDRPQNPFLVFRRKRRLHRLKKTIGLKGQMMQKQLLLNMEIFNAQLVEAMPR